MRALAKIKEPSTVKSITEFLKQKIDVPRKVAASVLATLTGQDFGEDSQKWEKWWKKNKTRILKGR